MEVRYMWHATQVDVTTGLVNLTGADPCFDVDTAFSSTFLKVPAGDNTPDNSFRFVTYI